MNQPKSDLANCPFCHGPAISTDGHTARCIKGEEGMADKHCAGGLVKFPIRLWNKRTRPPQPQGVPDHQEGRFEPISYEAIKDIGIDLIDKHFPKGECKERGAAIVLYAELIIAIVAKFSAPKAGADWDKIAEIMLNVRDGVVPDYSVSGAIAELSIRKNEWLHAKELNGLNGGGSDEKESKLIHAFKQLEYNIGHKKCPALRKAMEEYFGGEIDMFT